MKVGDKYGRWTIMSEPYTTPKRKRNVDVVCDCGVEKSVRVSSIRCGDSRSCGCLTREVTREMATTKGGRSKHPLYGRWNDMNRRCYDKNRKDYHHYGGRGIKVCDAWHRDNPQGFDNFINDMEFSFKEGLEIDRIDNDGDYCKDNCKWSSRSEQVVNRRFDEATIQFMPTWLNDGDETLHLSAMAKKYNITPRVLSDRIGKLGYSLEDALAMSAKIKRYVLRYQGVDYKVQDIFITQLLGKKRRLGLSNIGELLRCLMSDAVEVNAEIQGNFVPIVSDKVIEDHTVYRIKSEFFKQLFKPNINVEVNYK